VPFGKAHDHAREIVEEHKALEKLVEAVKGFILLLQVRLANFFSTSPSLDDKTTLLFVLFKRPFKRGKVRSIHENQFFSSILLRQANKIDKQLHFRSNYSIPSFATPGVGRYFW
jgi:hypothetical protein